MRVMRDHAVLGGVSPYKETKATGNNDKGYKETKATGNNDNAATNALRARGTVADIIIKITICIYIYIYINNNNTPPPPTQP